MGNLRDEAYEKLDYLSQLTEVAIGPQNDALASLPDKIELTPEILHLTACYTWLSNQALRIDAAEILNLFLQPQHREFTRQIASYFYFEVSDNCEVDLTNQTITGSIFLVKKNNQIEDKELLRMAVDQACGLFQRYLWDSKACRDRTATILDLLQEGSGSEWIKKFDKRRGTWLAYNAIVSGFQAAILENRWRIRDTTVIKKVVTWIQSYMTEGESGVGLVNLVKLKLMLDKDKPVYSIGEVNRVNPT